MFGHMPELFIILLIALIVFGPEKLPEMAQSVGRAVRDVRQAFDMMSHQEDHEVPEDFSTYYYESMARAGETPVEDEDQKLEDIMLNESDMEAINAEDTDSEHLKPIPFPSDRPDVFPSQSEMESLVPDPVDDESLSAGAHPLREETRKPGA